MVVKRIKNFIKTDHSSSFFVTAYNGYILADDDDVMIVKYVNFD